MVRKPCALASPHAASICSTVAVILPPSRMLAVANSFTRSAPSAFSFCTIARICSGVPEVSVIWRSEVRMRGPGIAPSRDHVAQIAVERRAHTLHGGEAAHQRGVGIGGGVQYSLRLGGLAAAAGARFVAAVFVEVPGDVDVGVDPSGHHGEAAEIHRGLLFRVGDTRDAPGLDGDLLVLEDMALAVD
jgi:hypothetical protein